MLLCTILYCILKKNNSDFQCHLSIVSLLRLQEFYLNADCHPSLNWKHCFYYIYEFQHVQLDY